MTSQILGPSGQPLNDNDEARGLRNHEDGVYYGQAGYIETSSGRHFYSDKPDFALEDIAHALSMCVRYNGHCAAFYSVAEHSLLVSYLMKERAGGDPFEGLMHDALEAYLSDVPAPLKQFLPDYKAFDDKLDTKLRYQFDLPPKKTEECKKADWLALFVEAFYLLPSQGAAFADPNNLRPEALALVEEGLVVSCMPPNIGEFAFTEAFKQLRPCWAEGLTVAH